MNYEDRKKWLWRDDPVRDRKAADEGHAGGVSRRKEEALSALMQAAALGEEDPFGEWAMRARELGAADFEIERALDGGRLWRRKALEQLEQRWFRNDDVGTVGGSDEGD
jgi:hypothetical protein